MKGFSWVLIVAIVVVAVVYYFLRGRGKKEKTVQCKVLSKEAVPHKTRGSDDDSMPTDYLVTFQAEGKNHILAVNHSFFDTVSAGTSGKLTYKGDVYVDFEDDNPRIFR